MKTYDSILIIIIYKNRYARIYYNAENTFIQKSELFPGDKQNFTIHFPAHNNSKVIWDVEKNPTQ